MSVIIYEHMYADDYKNEWGMFNWNPEASITLKRLSTRHLQNFPTKSFGLESITICLNRPPIAVPSLNVNVEKQINY